MPDETDSAPELEIEKPAELAPPANDPPPVVPAPPAAAEKKPEAPAQPTNPRLEKLRAAARAPADDKTPAPVAVKAPDAVAPAAAEDDDDLSLPETDHLGKKVRGRIEKVIGKLKTRTQEVETLKRSAEQSKPDIELGRDFRSLVTENDMAQEIASLPREQVARGIRFEAALAAVKAKRPLTQKQAETIRSVLDLVEELSPTPQAAPAAAPIDKAKFAAMMDAFEKYDTDGFRKLHAEIAQSLNAPVAPAQPPPAAQQPPVYRQPAQSVAPAAQSIANHHLQAMGIPSDKRREYGEQHVNPILSKLVNTAYPGRQFLELPPEVQSTLVSEAFSQLRSASSKVPPAQPTAPPPRPLGAEGRVPKIATDAMPAAFKGNAKLERLRAAAQS